MRKFHRWFGLITGIFMLIISGTGITIQTLDLISNNHDGPPRGAEQGPPPGSPTPFDNGQPPSEAASANQNLAPIPGQPNIRPRKMGLMGIVKHIHSGEYFGPIGIVINIICGFALFFFSISGIWIYWQMFQSRAKIGRKEIFW